MPFDPGEILLTILRNFANLFPAKIIHSYEQGVRYTFGKDKALIKRPGLYFYFPFFQKIQIMDVRYDGVDLANMSLETEDNKPLTLSGCVIFRVRNARLCYNNIGSKEEVKKILEMRGRGELSGIAWKYTYDQIRKREPKDSLDSKVGQKETVKHPELVLASVGEKGFYPSERESEPYKGNGDEDDEDDEIEREAPLKKGISELEETVRVELHKKVKQWGISVYDFSLTDSLNTRGFRIYGDVNPLG